ncbi:hypothetical protein JKY79_01295 [Candidatus Babeliales bacterium]|nr:hypothetical protein [Candidatus Babeliales bacterium]
MKKLSMIQVLIFMFFSFASSGYAFQGSAALLRLQEKEVAKAKELQEENKKKSATIKEKYLLALLTDDPRTPLQESVVREKLEDLENKLLGKVDLNNIFYWFGQKSIPMNQGFDIKDVKSLLYDTYFMLSTTKSQVEKETAWQIIESKVDKREDSFRILFTLIHRNGLLLDDYSEKLKEENSLVIQNWYAYLLKKKQRTLDDIRSRVESVVNPRTIGIINMSMTNFSDDVDLLLNDLNEMIGELSLLLEYKKTEIVSDEKLNKLSCFIDKLLVEDSTDDEAKELRSFQKVIELHQKEIKKGRPVKLNIITNKILYSIEDFCEPFQESIEINKETLQATLDGMLNRLAVEYSDDFNQKVTDFKAAILSHEKEIKKEEENREKEEAKKEVLIPENLITPVQLLEYRKLGRISNDSTVASEESVQVVLDCIEKKLAKVMSTEVGLRLKSIRLSINSHQQEMQKEEKNRNKDRLIFNERFIQYKMFCRYNILFCTDDKELQKVLEVIKTRLKETFINLDLEQNLKDAQVAIENHQDEMKKELSIQVDNLFIVEEKLDSYKDLCLQKDTACATKEELEAISDDIKDQLKQVTLSEELKNELVAAQAAIEQHQKEVKKEQDQDKQLFITGEQLGIYQSLCDQAEKIIEVDERELHEVHEHLKKEVKSLGYILNGLVPTVKGVNVAIKYHKNEILKDPFLQDKYKMIDQRSLDYFEGDFIDPYQYPTSQKLSSYEERLQEAYKIIDHAHAVEKKINVKLNLIDKALKCLGSHQDEMKRNPVKPDSKLLLTQAKLDVIKNECELSDIFCYATQKELEKVLNDITSKLEDQAISEQLRDRLEEGKRAIGLHKKEMVVELKYDRNEGFLITKEKLDTIKGLCVHVDDCFLIDEKELDDVLNRLNQTLSESISYDRRAALNKAIKAIKQHKKEVRGDRRPYRLISKDTFEQYKLFCESDAVLVLQSNVTNTYRISDVKHWGTLSSVVAVVVGFSLYKYKQCQEWHMKQLRAKLAYAAINRNESKAFLKEMDSFSFK